jgi:hypothetical protein
MGRLFPVGGSPSTVVGCLGPIGGRPRPIALGTQQNVLATRVRVVLKIVQTSQRIAPLRAPIAKRGSLITLLRRSQPPHGALVAQLRYGATVATRSLARQSAPVMGDRVATGGEIVVRSALIVIRAPLIPLTRRLVVIRPRLILIARRLVVIGPHLILIARGLVAITRRAIADVTNGTGTELAPARWAARTLSHLAASWTPHTLRHP